MTDNQDQINRLLDKLNGILKRQDDFSRDINALRLEIDKLKERQSESSTEKLAGDEVLLTSASEFELSQENAESIPSFPLEEPQSQQAPKETASRTKKPPKLKTDFEKFIGENLINKIGIAITVIGVAIGSKYSIENNLISPLTRIILGYLMGMGLLGFGMKLKKNYENYSAVLVGGAMAIMYFITYSAYSFYGLFPQSIAFGLMLLFTAFTVFAALHYNRQLIAHIGLVGAYAIPFLLSEGSGNVSVLFSYMGIINIGILVISFKRYWKALYYSSFGLTWLIFLVWFATKYRTEDHFALALSFLALFFILFYISLLAYKLLQKEKYAINDVILLLTNSFLFYGMAYVMLVNHETGQHLLGLYTLANALLHFGVSVVIYRQKLADRNLFYLIVGLVLIFITIAIPVQLDGNWVTLLWAAEAALLFWIGKTKQVALYEKLAYPLMILAFFSIMQDWSSVYNSYHPERPDTKLRPLWNINFLSSLLFIASFSFINYLNVQKQYSTNLIAEKRRFKFISNLIPLILMFSIYNAFRLEIENYWYQLYTDSFITINVEEDSYWDEIYNSDLLHFKSIWLINYSLLFVSLLAIINIKRFKSQRLGLLNLGLIAFSLLIFLTQGLYALSELRETYMNQQLADYYERQSFSIGIRYVSFIFVTMALLSSYLYLRQSFLKMDLRLPFDFLLHTSILWMASSELIQWLSLMESTQSYKLGLSILWGFYSLLLIAFGIWKSKKHLRIGAIALFGITLLKLFFYDISHLDTIAKTIVFVSLGVLLLVISFLYNKYKHIISDEDPS